MSDDDSSSGSGTDDDYDMVEGLAGTKRRYILEGNGGGGVTTNAWSKYIKRLARKELEDAGVCTQIREGRQGRKPKQLCGRASRSATRSANVVLTDYTSNVRLDNSVLVKNLVQVTLNDGKTQISIPLFLKVSCDFIRKHMDSEGIFRKPGSSSRKQRIMQDLLYLTAKSDLDNLFAPSDTVYDVCSALTQILRNLQAPLIPYDLHGVFLNCFDLQPRKRSVIALLESICLLPSASIAVLSYFVQFLQEVAQHSSKNLMVTTNLGVVMVENIMPTMPKDDFTDGCRTPNSPSMNARDKINCHSQIIETMIEYADRIGFLTTRLQERMRENPISLSDAGSSDEDDDGENSPRKKRRSSSLNRLFGIFRKNTNKSKSIDAADVSALLKTPSSFPGHTPVIKDGSKKFNSKTNRLNSVYNSHKQNQLFLQKNLALPNPNATPYNAFRTTTPAISLNPSPKFSANADTPFGPKRKYFASSNLIKKRLKTSPPEPKSNGTSVPVVDIQRLDTPKPKPVQMDLVDFEASPRKLQLQEPKLTKTNSTSTALGKSPRPRPHSFNSPRTTPTGNTSITRSPSTRRTLRRGRPNTLRVGLTRPSPTSNVVKIEPSPPRTGSGMLLRSSSSSGHVVKKESFMFGSGDTSPRKKVTIEPSGRVISRSSSGRPALDIPKPPVPEKPKILVYEDVENSGVDTHLAGTTPDVDKSSNSIYETPTATPHTSLSVSVTLTHSKTPRKGGPATRSQSMRDTSRSYIPRLITSKNLNKKASFRENIEEETTCPPASPTPTLPQKSVSTSAMTPTQQQLRRRNSVQELVKLYESTAIVSSKIPSAINRENGRPKPYPMAVKTLDRGKLEPFHSKFTSLNRPMKLQFTKPVWSTLPEQNLTKHH